MTKQNKTRLITFLLISTLLINLLTGCSKGNAGANGKVADKLELAVKYLAENKFEEAILAYQEVIKIDSKNVIAYKALSVAYSMQGNMAQAEQTLQDGLNRVADAMQLKLAMAGLLADMGKKDQAEALYKEIIAKDSSYLPAYKAYSKLLLGQGKKSEAIALLEKAASENPAHTLNSLLASLYIENRNSDKALESIIRSISADPDQSSSYKLLEQMYAGRWSELVALGDQYIRQQQTMTGYLFKLTGLYDMGKFEDILNQYGNLPAEIKDNTRVKFVAARSFLKSGRTDQAFELIKTIKAGEIKDAGMLADMAGLYLDSGDKETARKLALQGINVDATVLDNYLVMYNSYKGEDDVLARIWAIKYLFNSELGYNDAVNALAGSGIRVINKPVGIESVVFTPEQIEKFLVEHKEGFSAHRYFCYLDTSKNIAYNGHFFNLKAEENLRGYRLYFNPTANHLGKSLVVKIHNPKIFPISDIPDDESWNTNGKKLAVEKGLSYAVMCNNFYIPVALEGDSFENELLKAGIPLESIAYLDV